MTNSQKKNSQGRGWHGDPEAHAKAGRAGGKVSTGNFKFNPSRASDAGKKGGVVSPSNFKNNPARASAVAKARKYKTN